MKKLVSDIKVGDLLDLQGDTFADNGNHPEFEFEYQPVYEIEKESADCIVLHCDNFSCGFPPNYFIEISE